MRMAKLIKLYTRNIPIFLCINYVSTKLLEREREGLILCKTYYFKINMMLLGQRERSNTGKLLKKNSHYNFPGHAGKYSNTYSSLYRQRQMKSTHLPTHTP